MTTTLYKKAEFTKVGQVPPLEKGEGPGKKLEIGLGSNQSHIYYNRARRGVAVLGKTRTGGTAENRGTSTAIRTEKGE